MDQPPAFSPPPVPAPVKKGLPALAWVGIGCGGLLLIAIIVGGILVGKLTNKFKEFAANPEKAGAEMIVSMNPDLKKVSSNDEKGEMTIRTKDGELITLSYKDISEGKITVKDKDGNTTRIGSADLSQVPAWVPKAPDITDGISTYHSDTANEITGQFSGKSDQTMEQLKVFFDAETSTLGFGSNSSKSMNLNDTNVITNSYSGDGKTLTIIITEKSGEKTLINTNYTEKK